MCFDLDYCSGLRVVLQGSVLVLQFLEFLKVFESG